MVPNHVRLQHHRTLVPGTTHVFWPRRELLGVRLVP